MKNRLNITATANNSNTISSTPHKNSYKQEIQATMERLWHQDPEQFNPERDSIQRQRLRMTFDLLKDRLTGKRVADLGCGAGVFSRMMRDAGAEIYAVDVAGNALARLKEHDMHNITPVQDCMPITHLKDDYFDVVVCTEVVGYLPQEYYRVFFAELSRIVKNDGHVVCSTAIDLDSEDALERFGALAETEFAIDQWAFGYHRLLIKLCRFFEAPERYASSKSYKALALMWKVIDVPFRPIARWLRQSQGMMQFLERLCKLLWADSGISQAIFIGKRRPLTFPLPPSEIPIERKHKRQTWE